LCKPRDDSDSIGGNIPKDTVEQQKANTPIEKRFGTVDDVVKIVA
jgi:hypothetical protein